jgi:hypothetical protein
MYASCVHSQEISLPLADDFIAMPESFIVKMMNTDQYVISGNYKI